MDTNDRDDRPSSWYHLMETSVRELLIAQGIVDAASIDAQVADMDARTPARGAAVVARAWTDPPYKALLLADGNAALEAIGLDRGPYKLVVVENTERVHNVIVCTLCSCYPRWLLGLPPDWYKSHAYRARTVSEPRAVLAEFGCPVPDDVAVRVHDSTADMRYLVLPARPAGTDGLDAAALAALVTRDSMVGTGRPHAPTR
ncbi:MAG: nitrile hydratase subunit alpha [Burkholderiales bacterium]|nr:nitrile hydratase subunit alpha [Burkholderiales bacterium]